MSELMTGPSCLWSPRRMMFVVISWKSVPNPGIWRETKWKSDFLMTKYCSFDNCWWKAFVWLMHNMTNERFYWKWRRRVSRAFDKRFISHRRRQLLKRCFTLLELRGQTGRFWSLSIYTHQRWGRRLLAPLLQHTRQQKCSQSYDWCLRLPTAQGVNSSWGWRWRHWSDWILPLLDIDCDLCASWKSFWAQRWFHRFADWEVTASRIGKFCLAKYISTVERQLHRLRQHKKKKNS